MLALATNPAPAEVAPEARTGWRKRYGLRKGRAAQPHPNATVLCDVNSPRYIRLGDDLHWARIEYRTRIGPDGEAERVSECTRARVEIGRRISHRRLRRVIVDPGYAPQARKEIAGLCREVWELYRVAAADRRREMRVFLVESIAEAQLLGVDDPVVREMLAELRHLVRIGAVKCG